MGEEKGVGTNIRHASNVYRLSVTLRKHTNLCINACGMKSAALHIMSVTCMHASKTPESQVLASRLNNDGTMLEECLLAISRSTLDEAQASSW